MLIHAYDELGRRIETTVDDTAFYPPPAAGEPDNRPPGRVSRITYAYETDGLLSTITAYTTGAAGETVLAQNQFDYDARRNLTTEWQAHGAAVGAGTPAVDYAWDFQPAAAGNYNRLASLTYPARLQTGASRTLQFDYGNNTSDIDSLLGRITQVADSEFGVVASFLYSGLSRQIETTYGNGVIKTAGQVQVGCSCADRFGRVTDLHFTDSQGGTIHRYQYEYDASGHRSVARVTQMPHGGAGHDNDRSFLYAYDGLSRLVQFAMGMLTQDNTDLVAPPTGATPTERTWSLDNLGNFSGGDAASGSVITTGDLDGDGTVETTTFHHSVDLGNAVTQVWTDGAAGPVLAYDRSGNLVYDGAYIYQYDAFNRLVQVNETGAAQVDVDGRVIDGSLLGPMAAHFAYDGLGRLIKREVPTVGGVAAMHLYYDGSRRVQEVIDDGTGDWTERAYVHGVQYVDEFLLQVDADGNAIYMLQDASYNVVGLMDAAGAMLAQYTYAPYGTVLAADVFAPHAANRVGHQGLFFQRLDAWGLGGSGNGVDVACDPDVGGNATCPLSLEAIGLYYNRNRTYAPALGRFLQRDPNGTALPLSKGRFFHGQAPSASRCGQLRADGRLTYLDGMNLYQYLESNPLYSTDPSGQFVIVLLPPVAGALADALVAAGVAAGVAYALSQILDPLREALAELVDYVNDLWRDGRRSECVLIRKQRAESIHPGRPDGPLGNYWECVYECPGVAREIIVPGTVSVLFECPPTIPNTYR